MFEVTLFDLEKQFKLGDLLRQRRLSQFDQLAGLGQGFGVRRGPENAQLVKRDHRAFVPIIDCWL